MDIDEYPLNPYKILILHFFVPTSDQANLQMLSRFTQNRKGSLQVIAITGDHLGKLTFDPASVNFPLVKLNQAEWDLFEFRFGSQIKVLPTTLTVIGDGLFLSEQYHDQLSNSVCSSNIHARVLLFYLIDV